MCATGLGIGLNLSYGLVRAMGGELRYESVPGNTRFWFSLPAEGAKSIEAAETYTPAPPTPEGSKRAAIRTPALKEWDRLSRRAPRHSRKKGAAEWSSIAGATNTATATAPSSEPSGTSIQHSPSRTSDSDTSSFTNSKRGGDDDGSMTSSESALSTMLPEPSAFEELPKCTKQVDAHTVSNHGLKAFERPHVLVVEDTEMCADVLTMLLDNLGCSSEVAENGQVALEKLGACIDSSEPNFYSIILMDLRMPVVDGFQATEIIKGPLNLTVPVVAITADDTQDSRERCAKIGFDDFASKPMQHETLAAILEKHTGHKVTCEDDG